jgi:hypothetical protein
MRHLAAGISHLMLIGVPPRAGDVTMGAGSIPTITSAV